jgi:hypothetical protein
MWEKLRIRGNCRGRGMFYSGLGLSFRVHSATFWRGAGIVALVTVGLVAPLAMGMWYTFGGGTRLDHRRSLARYAERDPARDAQDAIATRDLRMFLVRDGLDVEVPGIGHPDNEYRDKYGYRALILLRRDDLTDEEHHLNESVRAYAAAFNRVMASHVGAR